jgi:hypothetical protein
MVNVKLVLVRTRTLVQKKTDLKNTNKERTIFDHGIRPIVHCRHLCLNTSVQLTTARAACPLVGKLCVIHNSSKLQQENESTIYFGSSKEQGQKSINTLKC